MKRNSILTTCLLCLSLFFLFSFDSYAVERITAGELSVTVGKADPGIIRPITITVGGSANYTISNITWSKEYDKWEPGKEVTAVITLKADSGYQFFSTQWSSNIGTITDKNNEKSTATLKLVLVPSTKLKAPSNPRWDPDKPGWVQWDKVPRADGYLVAVLKDGKRYETISCQVQGLDLSDYLVMDGQVTFQVKARMLNREDRRVYQDSDYSVCRDTADMGVSSVTGAFVDTSKGVRFMLDSGGYATGWEQLLGSWYHFDKYGYAAVGWTAIDGKWFLFDSKGKMKTGWQRQGKGWYYFKHDGSMLTGWYADGPNGHSYYFNENGLMCVGWTKIDDLWYYFYSDGRMATDTVIDSKPINSEGQWIPEEDDEDE